MRTTVTAAILMSAAAKNMAETLSSAPAIGAVARTVSGNNAIDGDRSDGGRAGARQLAQVAVIRARPRAWMPPPNRRAELGRPPRTGNPGIPGARASAKPETAIAAPQVHGLERLASKVGGRQKRHRIPTASAFDPLSVGKTP